MWASLEFHKDLNIVHIILSIYNKSRQNLNISFKPLPIHPIMPVNKELKQQLNFKMKC